MEKGDLISYIEYAIDIESKRLVQENVMKQYQKKASETKPQKPKRIPPPSAPIKQQSEDSNIVLVFCCYAGAICLLIAFFLLISAGYSVFALLSLCGSIYFFVVGSQCFRENREFQNNYKEAYARYQAAIVDIENKNRLNEEYYQENLPMWKETQEKSLSSLKQHIYDIDTVIQQYYSVGIIYPKYRNLPALTSILEYLKSGRCEALTGIDGAYNLYENELYQQSVISQLDIVIKNLETIKNTQYILYETVQNINAQVSLISNEMKLMSHELVAIESLQTLSAFYSSVAITTATALAFVSTIG